MHTYVYIYARAYIACVHVCARSVAATSKRGVAGVQIHTEEIEPKAIIPCEVLAWLRAPPSRTYTSRRDGVSSPRKGVISAQRFRCGVICMYSEVPLDSESVR